MKNRYMPEFTQLKIFIQYVMRSVAGPGESPGLAGRPCPIVCLVGMIQHS